MEKDLKDLLLVDLCARLPYSVKILVQSWDEREMEYTNRVDTLYSVYGDNYINTTNEDYDFYVEDIKPYLFPLSSMNEGQKNFIRFKLTIPKHDSFDEDSLEDLIHNNIQVVRFCYKNHLDINGLIPMGLAIDATNLNIY